MHIEGTYTLEATPTEVWQSLLDHRVLTRALPGIRVVEQSEDDSYLVKLHLGNSDLYGDYTGRVRTSEQQFPYRYKMHITGEGRQSAFTADGHIELQAEDEGKRTIIAYQGTLTIHKLGDHIPMSIIKGALMLYIQQFFNGLAEYLRSTSTTFELTLNSSQNGKIIFLPEQGVEKRSLLTRLLQRLGFRKRDAARRQVWVTRTRRVGFASVLLLLVWVGTRLPRLFSK